MPVIKDRQALLRLPLMQEAYDLEYPVYQPDPAVINQLKPHINGKRIYIILGSWCSDSRKEIPRFYQVADQAGLTEQQIQLLAVDESKVPDVKVDQELNFNKVPVFICFDESGIECGRITESPENTIETDLLQIFKK